MQPRRTNTGAVHRLRAKAADVLRLAKAAQTRDTIAADLGFGVVSLDRILGEARATGASTA
jgi:hypothetical protein